MKNKRGEGWDFKQQQQQLTKKRNRKAGLYLIEKFVN